MRMITGHVESVVNRPDTAPSLVIKSRTPLGTYFTECIVGQRTHINRDAQRIQATEVHPGDFVVATLRTHAGWLEAERIDIVKLSIRSPIGISEAGAQ